LQLESLSLLVFASSFYLNSFGETHKLSPDL
jgi:hypothetical protein